MLLASCEQVMFIDISDNDPKLVINGIVSHGSGMWVNVTESVGATKPEITSFVPVEDATVRVFHGDALVATITENNTGNYFSSEFVPLQGESYDIEVEAEGLPVAGSFIEIPGLVEITGYDTSTLVRPGFFNNQGASKEVDFFLDLSIDDPEEPGNYYMLGAYLQENEQRYPLNLDTEDLDMNVYISDGMGILACNDENFNGKEKVFQVRSRLAGPEGFQALITISLYSIEKEYFDYLKSYSQNFTVLNSDMILFEPVLVSTNIDHGYGIIAAVSESSVQFKYVF